MAKKLYGTDKHKSCNHHHKLTEDQELVDFGSGEFVADKPMIPLLKALNELGLVTRTHCFGHEHNHPFVSILLENGLEMEVRKVSERDSSRDFPPGTTEILLHWDRPSS